MKFLSLLAAASRTRAFLRGSSASAAFLLFLSCVAPVSSDRPALSGRPAKGDQTKGARAFLWEIKSPTATAYLFGSIHLGDKSLYPLRPEILSAFQKAGVMGVEARTDKAPEVQRRLFMLTFRYGFYRGDRTLRDDLSREDFALLKKVAAKSKMPVERMERMKPWLAALTLSLMQVQKKGKLKVQYGIEHYFHRENKKLQKPKEIIELEGAEFQVKLFGTLALPKQVLFLRYTLQDIDGKAADPKTEGQSIRDMVAAYKRGDAKFFQKNFLDGYFKKKKYEFLYRLIFVDRNRGMARKIETLLEKKKTYFLIIGALHLVGEKSIIEFLRRSGKKYSIRRL